MRMNMRIVALSLVMVLIIPGVMMLIAEKLIGNEKKATTQPSESLKETQSRELIVSVLMEDGRVENIEADDYLVSVLLREMPSSFALEALKAQAVVARTYLLRRYEGGGRHENADICTDSSCCQAYWDVEQYFAEGGKM